VSLNRFAVYVQSADGYVPYTEMIEILELVIPAKAGFHFLMLLQIKKLWKWTPDQAGGDEII